MWKSTSSSGVQRVTAGARRRGLAFAAILATFSLIVAPMVAPTAAHANPSTGFDPGHIVSDGNFYNGAAMSAAQVQTFLNQRVPRCTIGDSGRKAGSVWGDTRIANHCLKDARFTTSSRASNAYCKTYPGASNETAAAIIAKVGQACGISPKVLVVMLEKEQSLITDSWPTVRQFDVAMGYACPDSGPNNSPNCDMSQTGFFQQVYRGAWQLQVYKAHPNSYNYQPFQTNRIQWHPNAGCGTSQVYIENWATAALYIYTPYRPNQAALNAGWGTGDSCSSYGNRNFYNFYNQWFGSPILSVDGRLVTLYEQLGGLGGSLGSPTSSARAYSSTSLGQAFSGGSMYWSSTTGASAITAKTVLDYYWANGSWSGSLGFPIGTTVSYSGQGLGQQFANGSIYSLPATGPSIVRGAIRDEFWRTGSVSGTLGYPRGVETRYSNGGAGQAFQKGSVYGRSSGRAYSLSGEILGRYWAVGSVAGPLGYPTSDLVSYRDGGRAQVFEFGSMYQAPSAQAWEITGALRDRYWVLGSYAGDLGYPTSGVISYRDGGEAQAFQGGSMYRAKGGAAWEVSSAIRDRYWASGSYSGVLGYPTSAPISYRDGGQAQVFQRGSMYQAPGGSAWEVTGAIRNAYWAQGSYTGALGYPVSAPTSDGKGGMRQDFQGGAIAVDGAGKVTIHLQALPSRLPNALTDRQTGLEAAEDQLSEDEQPNGPTAEGGEADDSVPEHSGHSPSGEEDSRIEEGLESEAVPDQG